MYQSPRGLLPSFFAYNTTNETPVMPLQDVALSSINADKKFQTRLSGLNSDVTEQYSEAMLRGDEFPPIVLYDTPDGLILVDGFHRTEAASIAGIPTLTAEVIIGTHGDALHYSRYVANRKNGQRLSRADVERIVEHTLLDQELSKQSDRQLGVLCGCSHVTIGRYRKRLSVLSDVRVGADGRSYKIPERLPTLHLGDPPAGPTIDGDAGHSALERKVTDRLSTHLEQLNATLARQEFAGLGFSEEMRPVLITQLKAIQAQVEHILDRVVQCTSGERDAEQIGADHCQTTHSA